MAQLPASRATDTPRRTPRNNVQIYLHPVEDIKGDDAMDDMNPGPCESPVHKERQEKPSKYDEASIEGP